MEIQESKTRVYGPILPSGALLNSETESRTSKLKEPEYFGPKLPPHLQKTQNQPNEELPEENCNFIQNQSDKNFEIEPESYIGPLPDAKLNTQEEMLKQRALEIKIASIEASTSTKSDETIREEWMIELPGMNKSGLGIFAKQFRKKDAPDMSDRSIWTDTPNSKKSKDIPNKLTEKVIVKDELNLKRDKEQEALSRKFKKKHKREKSLMEIHSKKLKKEKKKKNKDKDKSKLERRPFNREEDLQVNRFDQARKQALIKKAALLDSKFSTGKSKYL